jgi:hypothetical protein
LTSPVILGLVEDGEDSEVCTVALKPEFVVLDFIHQSDLLKSVVPDDLSDKLSVVNLEAVGYNDSNIYYWRQVWLSNEHELIT